MITLLWALQNIRTSSKSYSNIFKQTTLSLITIFPLPGNWGNSFLIALESRLRTHWWRVNLRSKRTSTGWSSGLEFSSLLEVVIVWSREIQRIWHSEWLWSSMHGRNKAPRFPARHKFSFNFCTAPILNITAAAEIFFIWVKTYIESEPVYFLLVGTYTAKNVSFWMWTEESKIINKFHNL